MRIGRIIIFERCSWGGVWWGAAGCGGENLCIFFLICQSYLHENLYTDIRNQRQFIGQYQLMLIIENMHPHYFDTQQYKTVKQH